MFAKIIHDRQQGFAAEEIERRIGLGIAADLNDPLPQIAKAAARLLVIVDLPIPPFP